MPAENLNLTVTIKYRVDKYDGEKVAGDGKLPVETIEREETIPLTDYLKMQEGGSDALS